jgi:hypothetical protein
MKEHVVVEFYLIRTEMGLRFKAMILPVREGNDLQTINK